jgi:hypothetical protein
MGIDSSIKKRKRVKKAWLAALFFLMTFIAAAPWLLYAIGLRKISGRPTLPVNLIAADEAARLWVELRETGPVRVKPIRPWDYVLRFATNHPKGNAGESAAWFVARSWNINHLNNRKNIYWHLSGAAMTIWLSRNWTTEEILSKVQEIDLQKDNRKLHPND